MNSKKWITEDEINFMMKDFKGDDMENNINVNVEGDTIKILEGAAPKPINAQSFQYYGNIDAVSEYMNKMDPEIANTVVYANLEELCLYAFFNNNSSLKSSIVGELIRNNKLQDFKFNSGESFNMAQVIQLIRFNRQLFKNKDNSKILEKLLDFDAETKLQYKSTDDLKGNYNKQVVREKTKTIDMMFVLEAPIFKGEKAVSFPVEIIANQVDNGLVRFYFESIEFEEITEEQKKAIFQRELDKIDDAYVKIIKG